MWCGCFILIDYLIVEGYDDVYIIGDVVVVMLLEGGCLYLIMV